MFVYFSFSEANLTNLIAKYCYLLKHIHNYYRLLTSLRLVLLFIYVCDLRFQTMHCDWLIFGAHLETMLKPERLQSVVVCWGLLIVHVDTKSKHSVHGFQVTIPLHSILKCSHSYWCDLFAILFELIKFILFIYCNCSAANLFIMLCPK